MQGQMMEYQLTLTPLLERAQRLFPKKEIVTKAGAGLERFTYEQMADRVGRLANVLAKLGVKSGDRVATFAWNNARHLEIYFAAPCMGAVLHPLNLRLPADQLIYIVGHADDKVLFVDPTLLPVVEKLAPHFKNIKHYIVMGDKVPEGTTLSPVLCVRRPARQRQSRVSLAAPERERCGRHVLHIRDNGQPQRRGLLAPLDLPAQPGTEHDRLVRPFRSGRVHAGRADVPRVGLGHAFRHGHAGDETGLPRSAHAAA